MLVQHESTHIRTSSSKQPRRRRGSAVWLLREWKVGETGTNSSKTGDLPGGQRLDIRCRVGDDNEIAALQRERNAGRLKRSRLRHREREVVEVADADAADANRGKPGELRG